ncbi:Crp/Fnr family transcriptional regulator [Fictibacillus sp. 7GRE50]|uniref:Crp/Fnr family transcriptional regulator n=1 Tax=unclassified Fictibacillus TaxID=2644029 RepID=UPI0018CCFACF|nr:MULTISPECIES: Crp/Fnr family transcriptional regulator [unclassified Fictibacillus]MBH0164530.1 Crp/Fnr family transcriptional regulator [Fictibacillus sp. 7GRE50]MBH0175374.1 Crp/Fnr family transcriptional regulator [Fictibacillus sp. 23RED33]
MLMAKGEILFRQGEEGPLFRLDNGLLKIVRVHEDGSQVLLNLIVPGEVIPHHSLTSPNEYNGTAIALLPSEITRIEPQQWYRSLEEDPYKYKEVALMLETKLRMMQQRINQMSTLTPEGKIRKLQNWFANYFPDIQIEKVLTQEEIGQFVGLRRETVNRALKKI